MFKRLKENILEIVQQADLILLGLCCAASVFGIAMIYSATRYNNDNRKIIVQTAALLIGIVVYFAISMIDLEMLIKRWKWIAAFDVLFILLLKTPFGVSDDTGNTAWLKFPFLPVSIGPAEVVKITFIILLAWQLQWLREEKRDLRSFSAAFYVGGHTLGIAGLYFVISGDMGNALMFLLIFVVMSFVAGFALRWFALLFGAVGAAIGGIVVFDLVPDSKKYMLNRFLVIFDHSYDVQHTGWQQTRSLLALGGGKLTGQGLFHGIQTQGEYSGSLPFRYTDFIFSAIGEELGMLGCLAVLLLLAAIIAASISTADSQLLVASSSFTADLYKPFFRKNATEKETLMVGRILVLVLSAIAFLIANSKGSGAQAIMDMVENAWGAFGASFGPTILLSLFWRRFNYKGAVAGVVSGFAVDLGWLLTGLTTSTGIFEIVPGFIASFIIAVIVAKCTAEPNAKAVEIFDKGTSKDAD